MKNVGFEYSYSAPTAEERREAESIRREYAGNFATDKLQKLRRLDGIVKGVPRAVAISLGAVGVLTFGLGLTCALEWSALSWGAALAAAGIVAAGAAYPIHKLLKARLKCRYGQRILRLTDEILGNAERDR